MKRYTEEKAINISERFSQLAVEFMICHPEANPLYCFEEMVGWIKENFDEQEILDWIEGANDYVEAFFARTLDFAYNWTHGGKERFEAAKKELDEFCYIDENGDEVLGCKVVQ